MDLDYSSIINNLYLIVDGQILLRQSRNLCTPPICQSATQITNIFADACGLGFEPDSVRICTKINSNCTESGCNHGSCVSNICRCDPRYSGNFCEKCASNLFKYPECITQQQADNMCNHGVWQHDQCICQENAVGEFCKKEVENYLTLLLVLLSLVIAGVVIVVAVLCKCGRRKSKG